MKKIKKNLKWITISILMIVIVGGVLIKYSLDNNKFKEISIEEIELEEKNNFHEISKQEKEIEGLTENIEDKNEELKNVYVDIKGAVKKPGVYEISEDKKVIDVLELAGGLAANANTTMINLAKKVFNEMVIIIYTDEEVKSANKQDTIVKIVEKECICPEIKNDACLNSSDTEKNDNQDKEEISSKVNINKATLEELLTVSGIGESKAKAIIEYRQQNGEFKKIEDIMEVSGIGEALYEKIKNNITI